MRETRPTSTFGSSAAARGMSMARVASYLLAQQEERHD